MSRETVEDAAYRQREELRDEVRELRKAVEVLTGLMGWAHSSVRRQDSGGSLTWDRGIEDARSKREALDD